MKDLNLYYFWGETPEKSEIILTVRPDGSMTGQPEMIKTAMQQVARHSLNMQDEADRRRFQELFTGAKIVAVEEDSDARGSSN